MASCSPYANVGATRRVLERHGLATKHALGQNFLVSDDIVRKIVELADVGECDDILEVGPGIGTLTAALLPRCRSVISVEMDPDLPAVLAETCAPWQGKFALVEMDAMRLRRADLEQAASCRIAGSGEPGEGSRAGGGLPTKLVSNLPYEVASALVLRYFQEFPFIASATVMVQREVGERMAARPGTKDYGAYTVKLGLLVEPTGRFLVGPGNFFPPPRVTSMVIRLERRTLCDSEGKPMGKEVADCASMLADAAFTARRKTLANSFKQYFSCKGERGARVLASLGEVLEECGIDERRRGETLRIEDFVIIAKTLLAREND